MSSGLKLLFHGVKRDSTLYQAASFPSKTAIGGVASWRIFDGFF